MCSWFGGYTPLVSWNSPSPHPDLLPPLFTMALTFWRDEGSFLVNSVSGFVWLFPRGFFCIVSSCLRVCCKLELRDRKTWFYSGGWMLWANLVLRCSVSCRAVPCAVLSGLCGDARSSIGNVSFPLPFSSNLWGESWAPYKCSFCSNFSPSGFQHLYLTLAWMSFSTSWQSGDPPPVTFACACRCSVNSSHFSWGGLRFPLKCQGSGWILSI